MTEILWQLSQAVVAVLAPAIAAGLVALLVQLVRKVGLTIEADQAAKVEYQVQQILLRVGYVIYAKTAQNQLFAQRHC